MVLLPIFLMAAAAAPNIYDGGGTEPFWGFTISRKEMVVDDLSAERKIRAKTPVPVKTRIGASYTTPTMTVRILHEACSDGMSETNYTDILEVAVKDYVFSGCGGPTIPEGQLAGSSWHLVTVDGIDVPARPDPPLGRRWDKFAIHWQLGSTFHAELGCGILIGRYRAKNGRITITERPVPATAQCTHGDIEKRVLAILAEPVTWRWPKDPDMLAEIGNRRGTIRLERRY